jgi:hypothetical protein
MEPGTGAARERGAGQGGGVDGGECVGVYGEGAARGGWRRQGGRCRRRSESESVDAYASLGRRDALDKCHINGDTCLTPARRAPSRIKRRPHFEDINTSLAPSYCSRRGVRRAPVWRLAPAAARARTVGHVSEQHETVECAGCSWGAPCFCSMSCHWYSCIMV